MSLHLDYFWGEIFGRANDGSGSLPLGDEFGESVVGEGHVPIRVHEDVFWFEVAIHDVEGVEVLEGEEDLGGVEEGGVLGEELDLLEVGEEFSSAHELHDEVDVLCGLEGELEGDEEGVVDLDGGWESGVPSRGSGARS